MNRDFPTFSRICIFFLLIFSLLTLLTSAFQLSILSEVSLLNFLRPIFGPYFVRIFPYTGLIYSRYLQFRFLKWPLIMCLISRSAMISYHHFQSESPLCFPLHHGTFEDFPASFDHRGWYIIKYHINIH